jgi:AraC-like DNA-binding protein/mannose-6-phosphate isomerase-like protein (cupin superfamily)
MGMAGEGWGSGGSASSSRVSSERASIRTSDPALPIEVRSLYVGPGGDAGIRERDLFELTYVSAGSGELLIQERHLPAKRGDLVVVGSSLGHRLRNSAPSPLALVSLLFHPDLIRGDIGEEAGEYLTPFLWQDAEFPHVIPARTGIPKEVFGLLGRIAGELPAAGPRARLAVKTYLRMALMLLVNHFAGYADTAEKSRRRQRQAERLAPLYRHLGAHTGEALQVKDAARLCAMSESHFMAFFREATGQSFVAHLNRRRIEHAQAWLAATDRPVLEISQELGFCDQSYFSAVFRKLTGLPPAAYRKRFQAEGARKIEARRGVGRS